MTNLVITTQQLQYLLAIDRSPTWAEAAEEVGVSPSALSQGVAELERRLGVALFEREGRRRVPTRDHAEVLRYAAGMLSATDDLARWAESRRSGRVGTARLGMIDAAATHHFRDVVRSYRGDHPDVELRLVVAPSGALLESLRRADLDVVVCVRPDETPPGIDVVPVLDDPLAVLGPDGSTPETQPRDWGPWVTFPAGAHTRRVVAAAVRVVGARFDVVAESHQPEVLIEMVGLGLGWTVLPLAGMQLPMGVVVVRDRIATRQLVVARRTDRAPDPVTDDLARALTSAS